MGKQRTEEDRTGVLGSFNERTTASHEGGITSKQLNPSPPVASPPPLTREAKALAIGPATDQSTPLSKEATADGPILYITLLLASTGARHPFKLDGKYLKKRGVEVEDNNPINMSLYKLKELILRDWREGENAGMAAKGKDWNTS